MKVWRDAAFLLAVLIAGVCAWPPSARKPAELTLAMRYMQEQKQPAGWKKTLFEGLIPHPGRMEWATFPLRLYQALGIRRLVYALGLTRLLPGQPRDMEAMLPHLPQRPLRQSLPEVTPARGETKYKVGFFLGCAQSLLFAEESAATVRVLSRNGCQVNTPSDVECCGMPAHGYGRLDLVRKQAQHNISVFEAQDVDVIVTDCATCGSTLKEYGAYLKDDPEWAERAEAFGAKVRDVSEFLAEIPLEKPQRQTSSGPLPHTPDSDAPGNSICCQPQSPQWVAISASQDAEQARWPKSYRRLVHDWVTGTPGSHTSLLATSPSPQ